MSSIWTVSPETNRIDLEYGGHKFWIEVKRDLTIGEQRRVETAGWQGYKSGAGADAKSEEVAVDWSMQSLARTLAYLVDWSLVDDKAVKLPLDPPSRKRDTVEALRQEVYAVIEEAISAHIARRSLEKKVPDGERSLRAISG